MTQGSIEGTTMDTRITYADGKVASIARHWGRNHVVINGLISFTGTLEDCERVLDVLVPADGTSVYIVPSVHSKES